MGGAAFEPRPRFSRSRRRQGGPRDGRRSNARFWAENSRWVDRRAEPRPRIAEPRPLLALRGRCRRVTLDDKRATTQQLLRGGADIYTLNTVRKHLSAIKGGWLAARTRGACHTLVISDVVGDDVSVIASGPTVADASTFADALALLQRFGGEGAYPAAAVARLRRGVAGGVPDTPKPGDARLAASTTTVVGSRRDAMAGAAQEAASLGYHVVRIDDAVIGEARTTAVAHLRAVIARASSAGRPACIVSSGETTVHVTGHGRGGRNQEFALAAAAAGLSADHALSDNNAYAFFDALGDLIHTGPTGTNVGDLQVILLA